MPVCICCPTLCLLDLYLHGNREKLSGISPDFPNTFQFSAVMFIFNQSVDSLVSGSLGGRVSTTEPFHHFPSIPKAAAIPTVRSCRLPAPDL